MSHDAITGQLCEQTRTRTGKANKRRAEERRKRTLSNHVPTFWIRALRVDLKY